jgi:hypothetical protein
MQPHEGHDREPNGPKKPERGARQTRWLLFVIAILLGLLSSHIAKRFM